MKHPSRKFVQHQQGLTLIEILIAVLIISIGLLGVAALHSSSLRNNYDALVRSHASALASDIVDRMRVSDRDALEDYEIDFGTTPAVEDDSPTSVLDLAEWKETLATQLPNGDGSIAVSADTRIITVTVSWRDRSEDGDGDDGAMQFQTETAI